MSLNLRRSMILATVLSTFALPTFASHSWGGYHWARKSNPFTLKLGNNLTSSDWSSHLRQTISDWNAGNSAVRTTEVAGTSNKRCAMVSGTTQVCNGTYGNNGWLGLASINLSGSHITQGSAKMNDTYFNTSTYNNTNEREHVMCQEVAHTFGLDHQSTDGSSLNTCMDYFSNTGANAGSTLSTKPNKHDFDELNTIYSHLDSTTTVANYSDITTASWADLSDDDAEGNTPAFWGRVINATLDGRTTTYEKELPNGDKLITFVIWADQARLERDMTAPGLVKPVQGIEP